VHASQGEALASAKHLAIATGCRFHVMRSWRILTPKSVEG
jgi:hypothetical protein